MWTRLELFLFIVSIKSVLGLVGGKSQVLCFQKFPSAEDDPLKLQLCWRPDLIFLLSCTDRLLLAPTAAVCCHRFVRHLIVRFFVRRVVMVVVVVPCHLFIYS